MQFLVFFILGDICMKIAICDDDNNFINEFNHILKTFCLSNNIEFTTDNFTSGREILECYLEYDIIFLDIDMPKINGFTVADKINEKSDEVKTPYIVFITSHDNLVWDALLYKEKKSRFGAFGRFYTAHERNESKNSNLKPLFGQGFGTLCSHQH